MQPDGTFEIRIQELSRILVSETPLTKLLQDVVDLAANALHGCDHCGVTLVRDGDTRDADTAVATDEQTHTIDKAQYKNDEGPCLEAVRTNAIIVVDDLTRDDRFPKFRPDALAAGMRSSLSFPLVAGDECIGALNVYAETPNAFNEISRLVGLKLADQASIALANARSHDEALRSAEHLTKALDRRGAIERAKGILMATRRIDEQAAFDILRKSSQFQNKKLFDVALEIQETHARSIANKDSAST